jgi:hypothetical protein
MMIIPSHFGKTKTRGGGARLALTSLGLIAPSSLCMSQEPGSTEPLPGLNLNHSASGRRVGVLPCHTSVRCNKCDVGGDSRVIQACWGAPACFTRWWGKESSKARCRPVSGLDLS